MTKKERGSKILKRSARDFERDAEDEKRGYDPEVPSDIGKREYHERQGELYKGAAGLRIRRGDVDEAMKDYLKAEISYRSAVRYSDSEGERRKFLDLADKCRRKIDRLKSLDSGTWHGLGFGLEGASAAAAILGILAGVFFLFEPTFTGNAIGNLSNSSSIGTGMIFLALGLIGALIYVSKKR